MVGSSKEVVNRYSKVVAEREAEYARKVKGDTETTIHKRDERIITPGEYRFGLGYAELLEVQLINSKNESTTIIDIGEEYVIKARVLFKKDMEEPIVGFMIKSLNGLEISGTSTLIANSQIGKVKENTILEVLFTQKNKLNPGSYAITSSVAEIQKSERVFHDRRLDVIIFKVIGAANSYGLVECGSSISFNRN